ncbi:energy transducer TonB [Geomesophilobacter sediminis]|uniref:TonB family protein n=1 Tax=Geomesophilobacter sediminis TaxID=2798584 RepID=A0A8J7SC23_9BACT|nr:TonB family protein [Geomesophilobacter sediminis]MBJ6726764.1 TonB family protein [Geomesophilobacter sediminis]
MDRLASPPQLVQKNQNYFLYGIAASALLHVICSAMLLAAPKGVQTSSAITYLDLKMAQLQAPMSAPQAQPAVTKAPPEPVSVAKSEPQPVQAPTPAAVSPAQAAEPPAIQPKAPATESLLSEMGLGLSRGFFKSISEGASLRSDIRPYYIDMLQAINEKWWLGGPAAGSKRIEPVIIAIVIARNGEIVDQRLLKRSGNDAYDRTVLESIRKASPLPPLPASYEGDFFQAPIRLVPPLDLMRS